MKFYYRRDTHKTPEHFIRAYRLRDKETGKGHTALDVDPSGWRLIE